MVKNKKGWLKVLEAFIAISLLLTFVVIITQTQISQNKKVFLDKPGKIIDEIQINDSLRKAVLTQTNLPSYSNQNGFNVTLKNYISKTHQDLIFCVIGICKLSDSCILSGQANYEIYSKETLILGDADIYSPRKLKIFCMKQ